MTTIAVKQGTHKQLRKLAAETNLSIGELVQLAVNVLALEYTYVEPELDDEEGLEIGDYWMKWDEPISADGYSSEYLMTAKREQP